MEKRKMKLYISGKITGDENYKAKFAKAKSELEASGYEVCNPADISLAEGATWDDYMAEAVSSMIRCVGIALLDDWFDSKGARQEMLIATQIGMPVELLGKWIKSDALF